jgi:hypothetical protein
MEFQIVDVAIDVVSSISRVGVHLAHDGFATTILSFRVNKYNKKNYCSFFWQCVCWFYFYGSKENHD